MNTPNPQYPSPITRLLCFCLLVLTGAFAGGQAATGQLSWSTSPGVPVLTLTNSTSRSNAVPGEIVNETLAYTNTGNAIATAVTLTNTLPTGMGYLAGSASGVARYDAASRTLTWQIGSVPAGSTGQVTFKAILASSVPVGSIIANQAEISCKEAPLVVVSNVSAFGTAASQRGDWWMLGHDQCHTGQSAFNGPSTPTKNWAYPTRNYIMSSPTLGVDGTIYVGSGDGNLYALKPDGTLKWFFATKSDVESSPALGTDGTIYVGSNDGNLYAIAPDGTRKWAFRTNGYVFSSPVIDVDGTIYVGSDDGNLYAVNPDGSKKWSFAGNQYGSSPAIGPDGTIYVGSWDTRLYAVTPAGKLKWTLATGDYIGTSPVIGADGTIYVGSWDKKLYAVNPNGTKKWTFNTGGNISSSPAIALDGTIYIAADNQNLYAVAANGTLKWIFTTIGRGHSSPACGADGTIYLGAQDNNLYAINPDGTAKWTSATGGWVYSSPSLSADGTIYVGATDGKLYAIGAATLSAVSLSAVPASPQPVNTSINLTAVPNAGGNVEYRFRVGYTDAGGTHWNDITSGYTTTPTCAWKPTLAATYTLVVWARTVGHTANYDVYSSLTYQVNSPSLSAVSLTAAPPAPQPINSSITLTAVPTGGTSVEYKFRAGYQDAAGWHWSDLNNYTTTPTCSWKPTLITAYSLVVWARTVGHTTNFDVSATITYQAVNQPLSGVSLSATPTGPKPINTAITLTAIPSGGTNLEYEFRAGYFDGVWHWSVLTNGYTPATTYVWKPNVSRNYTLVVWVRTVGNTSAWQAYQAMTYQITP